MGTCACDWMVVGVGWQRWGGDGRRGHCGSLGNGVWNVLVSLQANRLASG